MTEVIGVRFKKVGKVYYFDPNGTQVREGEAVIVETARGVECGEVMQPNHEVPDDSIVKPLKKVVRKATESDLKVVEDNARLEKDAFRICEEKIAKHKLEMKLVAVEYTFDHSKILFYFSADGRIDFRELVKDLASVFRTRIELRQIGVRDEAKMIGGLGICGRPLCCTTFLDDFQPVSINMAKDQGLSLNPTKISGTCGRLMCCLKYESDTYKELIRSTPKVDSVVDTPQGRGTVMDVSLLKGCCKVRLHASPDSPVVIPCAECCCAQHGGSCAAGASPSVSAEPAVAESKPENAPPRPARPPRKPAAEGGKAERPAREAKEREPRPPRGDRNPQRPPRERKAQSEQADRQPKAQPARPAAAAQAPGAEREARPERPNAPRRRHRGGRGGQRHNNAERKKPENNHTEQSS